MSISVRTRRVLSRIGIGCSLACLTALVAIGPLRHRAVAGGWAITICAVISIAGFLYYLHGTKGQL